MKPDSIDEVIQILEDIIQECRRREDALGYFAVLYHRVTVQVKQGIQEGFFDDGDRMEQLDVVFAMRYINAYYAYRAGKVVTLSWAAAFAIARADRPIVLQHLLAGINAHINLDLGIAAAEICRQKNIHDLHNDFNKINAVLSALVDGIQQNLCAIWPTLTRILHKTGKIDNCIVDFSMELARDGAWNFAVTLAGLPDSAWHDHITARDEKVAQKAKMIKRPGWIAQLALWIIRLGERGDIAAKIEKLKEQQRKIQLSRVLAGQP